MGILKTPHDQIFHDNASFPQDRSQDIWCQIHLKSSKFVHLFLGANVQR